MHVYLIRHATAFERDRERWPDDGLRPLTRAGVREFREAAAGIARLAPRPRRLYTSPLLRALETADILTAVAGWPRATVTPTLAPQEPVQRALAVLREQEIESVALVGHEPHLTMLLTAAVAGARARAQLALAKGGAACIEFEGAVRAGSGTLAWLLTPDALRVLGERTATRVRTVARRARPRAELTGSAPNANRPLPCRSPAPRDRTHRRR